MTRHDIVSRIGSQYLTANIEEDEYSYAKDAGSKATLEAKVGHSVTHYKLDRRFVAETDAGRVVVLVETKQNFVDSDAEQLKAYLEEERALYRGEKVIAILANTNNDRIRVWKSAIDDEHLLPDETVLESMEYYVRLFTTSRQNDRETVMKNTYALNIKLHKLDIDEDRQPRGGYVKPSLFDVEMLDDGRELSAVENVHSSIVGTVVDYMARMSAGMDPCIATSSSAYNGTPAQPQSQTMGAARRDPRRGEIPGVRSQPQSRPAAQAWGSSVEYRQQM